MTTFYNQPPAYGAPPRITMLTSLSCQWIPITRTEELKDSSPKRFGIWTTFRYLEEVSIPDAFEWKLRFQIYDDTDGDSYQFHSVKMLSCGLSGSEKEDEEVYIEVEVTGESNRRLTESELNYIRSIDQENSDRFYMKYITWEDINEYIQSLNWDNDTSDEIITLVGGNIRGFATWMSKKVCLKIKE